METSLATGLRTVQRRKGDRHDFSADGVLATHKGSGLPGTGSRLLSILDCRFYREEMVLANQEVRRLWLKAAREHRLKLSLAM
jgi:hypothetical protein